MNLGIALLSSLFLAPHAVAATPLPAPKAALTVSTVSAKRWTMRVENTGDVPVRIVADPYLLSLEIMVPAGGDGSSKKAAKAHTVRCSLPADMRPSSDTSRGLVLPPGTAYSESFDPRMYCFGARESAGLVRGARVIAHYGFSAPHGAKTKGAALPPPFVVSPIASAEHPNQASAAPVKELIGASALELSSDAVASAPNTDSRSSEQVATRTTTPVSSPITSTISENDPSDPTLSIALPARSEAARAGDLNLHVSLTNVGQRRASVYFRPQTVAFSVAGPGGEFDCSADNVVAIRELFTTLSPRGRAQLSVSAANSCPDHSFDLPGLYEVRPRLDTRRVAGSPAGLHAFEGETLGTPALVRIRVGKRGILRPSPILE